ncbi:guanine nucleotide exchange factor [Phycomyces nitens]|nr:guanine nucleotide exchange factor [Phycomyces nitens]
MAVYLIVTLRALEALKLLGREQESAGPLFTDQGMRVLCRHAGVLGKRAVDTPCSREALKCIANSIHLCADMKQILEKDNILQGCADLLKLPQLSIDGQFLGCRILFFMTVGREDLVQRLISLDIGQCIAKICNIHVKTLQTGRSQSSSSPIHPMSVLSEALKLLFGLMLVDSRREKETDDKESSAGDTFKPCLGPIFDILFTLPCPEPLPLSPPLSHAVHCLMQFSFEAMEDYWKEHQKNGSAALVVETLVDVLSRSITYLIPNNEPDEVRDSTTVDATLSPLLLVLRTLAKGDPRLRQSLAVLLLPQESDRIQPVHQGTRLPAYLIRLMTCALLPQTRDAVSELLWTLCDEQASEFTRQVGYGNAIGFLVNKGIPMSAPSNSSGQREQDTNPITGQHLENEDQGPSLADMTDEEKEMEAERLFVLFERLKKTGVVDVENPIAKAMRENYGRFEELD